MRTYVLTVEIDEGSDEWWESFKGRVNQTKVKKAVELCLDTQGFSKGYGTRVRVDDVITKTYSR